MTQKIKITVGTVINRKEPVGDSDVYVSILSKQASSWILRDFNEQRVEKMRKVLLQNEYANHLLPMLYYQIRYQ